MPQTNGTKPISNVESVAKAQEPAPEASAAETPATVAPQATPEPSPIAGALSLGLPGARGPADIVADHPEGHDTIILAFPRGVRLHTDDNRLFVFHKGMNAVPRAVAFPAKPGGKLHWYLVANGVREPVIIKPTVEKAE